MSSVAQPPSVAMCYREGCLNPGTKTCSKCNRATYCSDECFRADWRARHKRACNLKLEDIPGFNELWADSCGTIDAGRYNVCIPQSKEILQRVLDYGMHQDDPQLSRIYHRMGHVYMGSGDYDSAEIYYKKAVMLAPPDDTDIVRGLICFYLNVYKTDEAEPLCERYLNMSEELYGRGDHRCSQPLRFYGILRHRQKRFLEAVDFLEEAYSNWSSHFGPVHPDVQRVTNDLVEALNDSQQHGRAEQFAEQNYDNAVTFSPEPNHLTVSDSAWSYARVLIENNSDLGKADELLQKALTIRLNLLGAEATRVAEILCSIVQLHLKTNCVTEDDRTRIAQACSNFSKAWGDSHPDAIKANALRAELETRMRS